MKGIKIFDFLEKYGLLIFYLAIGIGITILFLMFIMYPLILIKRDKQGDYRLKLYKYSKNGRVQYYYYEYYTFEKNKIKNLRSAYNIGSTIKFDGIELEIKQCGTLTVNNSILGKSLKRYTMEAEYKKNPDIVITTNQKQEINAPVNGNINQNNEISNIFNTLNNYPNMDKKDLSLILETYTKTQDNSITKNEAKDAIETINKYAGLANNLSSLVKTLLMLIN